jgi:hypothetical protein
VIRILRAEVIRKARNAERKVRRVNRDTSREKEGHRKMVTVGALPTVPPYNSKMLW